MPWRLSRGTQRRLYWFRWRGALLTLVFACAFVALSAGPDVSDRPGLPDASVLTRVYYALGLFVLGGMDLGTPIGGPDWARHLLWLSYFAAPTITASALVESFVRAVNPTAWILRRRRDHVIIAGCGKLGLLCLEKLREVDAAVPVLLIDREPDPTLADEAREVWGAHVLTADATSPALIAALAVERARRVLFVMGDDVSNLDAAANVIGRFPQMASRVTIHLSDLRMKNVVAHTTVGQVCASFNTHQIAARHAVEREILPHFRSTERRDTVVLVGFGRFGQTVLDELQTRALPHLGTVYTLDLHAKRRAAEFGEQIGYAGDYEHIAERLDARDFDDWERITARLSTLPTPPTFVLGTGDDGTNIRLALWLTKKFPEALVIARSFRRSSFAREVSAECGFRTVSVAELVAAKLPDAWFARPE